MRLQEQTSDLVDINYGIGSYEYWRSALTKNLRWMPGVTDRRTEGIEKLKIAYEKGVYTRLAAATGLIDIYINENSFNEALAIADEALKTYPESRWFLLGKARAHLCAQEYTEAEHAIRKVLNRSEKNPTEEHATIAVCHYWLAKTELAAGRHAECIAECDLMKTYQFNDDSKKLLENYFDELESMKKHAFAGRKSKRKDRIVSKNTEADSKH